MSGTNTFSTGGGCPTEVYGTLGQPAAANVPGGRYGAVGWTDTKGNLWFFGGWSCAYSSGVPGVPFAGDLTNCCFNDLREFNPSSNQWTWMGGSDQFNQPGVYGEVGAPATANVPGARENSVSWTDSKGNFWLFGGYGFDAKGTFCDLNDLWEFNPVAGTWDWMSGSSTVPYASGQSGLCRSGGQPGVYGTLGIPASGNTPGARANAVSWVDSSGNLWLFGGYGADSTGSVGYLNDLWKFNPSNNQWIWMGGSSTLGVFGGIPGVYESWMTPASLNFPGSRQSATGWTDGNGNFWLFGGLGYDSVGNYGYLNDLWEYNPSSAEWAWMDGNAVISTVATTLGSYGTQGSPGLLNTPGGRSGAAGWTDGNGNLWLFGGYAPQYPPSSSLYQTTPFFNDLWEYRPNSGSLTAAATPSFSLAAGVYPAGQVLAISDATPGATIYYYLSGSTSAAEHTGTLTVASTETVQAIAVALGYANSTVASASYTVALTAAPTFSVAPGTYPATQTVALSTSTPGAVIYYALNAEPTSASSVYNGPLTISASETVEAFAVGPGFSPSPVATASYTIWPVSVVNQWAWMGGSTKNLRQWQGNNPNLGVQAVYGSLGVPSAQNIPGPRQHSATWTDGSGNLWLFGGKGDDANGSFGYLNDLWRFNPATLEWTWMGGGQSVGSRDLCLNAGCGQPGVYGELGTAAAANVPGGREAPASWTDASGNLWLFGGYGYDSIGTLVYFNDLWKYSPATNQWTWMGGPSSVIGTCFGDSLDGFYCGGQPGVYGTRGTAATGNLPGGRYKAAGWTDANGNLWLFGGYTIDSANIAEYLFNDLWRFSPSSNQWTWMGGISAPPKDAACVFDPNSMLIYFCGQPGIYGTLGLPSQANMPGSRISASSWVDQSGNFWLGGGAAFDSYGNYCPLNDVWKFSPATNEWTWISGTSMAPLAQANFNSTGGFPFLPIDGTGGELGVPAAGNLPSLFSDAGGWADKSGNFWLFTGAAGVFATGSDDVWEFSPSANEWTWMSGGTAAGDYQFPVGGAYGTMGTPAAENTPGTLSGFATWTDNKGNLWLFGGTAIPGYMNDLWEYQPSAPAPIPSFAIFQVPLNNSPNGAPEFAAGTSSTITINVVASDGFDSPVALSATNLPKGITANFSPVSVTGAASSQMNISTDYTVGAGDYSLPVTGTSGNATVTGTVLLILTAAPAPAFTLGISPTALTVTRGSQGTATMTVTPQYGFNSAVSFACGGLPSGATCSFSPTSVTPSGAAVTSQLTIATSASAHALPPGPLPLFPIMALSAVACLLGFRKRRIQVALLAVVLAALVVAASCGGGGAGGGGGGGTTPPPVTTTITVTATATGAMQTTTLPLTIN